MKRIRPIAICIFRRENKILVAEEVDTARNQTFYRPLGGGIEFGERSEATVHREIREELGEEVTALRYLGTIENIFAVDEGTGHEIVQVYDGEFMNSELYQQDVLNGVEEGVGQIKAVWKNIDEFTPQAPLYPNGLIDILA